MILILVLVRKLGLMKERIIPCAMQFLSCKKRLPSSGHKTKKHIVQERKCGIFAMEKENCLYLSVDSFLYLFIG